MNGIDSFYEHLGFSLCEGFQAVLSAVHLPLIVAAGGLLHVTLRASEEGRPARIGTYLALLLLLTWWTAPVPRSPLPDSPASGNRRAPRGLLQVNAAADALQGMMLDRVNRDFRSAPFEWERIARHVATARIRDSDLLQDYRRYLERCHLPSLARIPSATPVPAPLDEVSNDRFGEDRMHLKGARIECDAARTRIRKRLATHLRDDPGHREALEAARAFDGGAGFEEGYLRTVAMTEWLAPHLDRNETRRVQQSVGTWRFADMGTYWEDVVGIFADLKQQWALTQEPRQKYYLAVLFAPHLYGFALFLWLGLFPVAAVWALAPGGWRALVNHLKILISIKCWPVLWGALSTVRGARRSLDAASDLPLMVDMREVWITSAALYFFTPVFCFLLVNIAVRAGSLALSQAAPGTAGAVSPRALIAPARILTRGGR